MMFRSRKGAGVVFGTQQRDWRQFQTRLEELLKEFRRLASEAAIKRACADAAARVQAGVPESSSSVETNAQQSDTEDAAQQSDEGTMTEVTLIVEPDRVPILEGFGVSLGPKPTRAEVLAALVQVLDQNRRSRMN